MNHAQQFVALTKQLLEFQDFWRDSPFYNPDMVWRKHYPELSKQVLQLSEKAFNDIDNSAEKLHQFLANYIPHYGDMLALLNVAQNIHPVELNKHLATGVSGRKWSQIFAFIGALPEKAAPGVSTVVDWCSGKAHLGRAVAHHWQRDLHGIEMQSQLCDEGSALAAPWVNKAHFSCKDVLAESHDFHSHEHVIALHACGDLHRTLLRQWLASNSQYLSFAPCCYHQWLHGDYEPLSAIAADNNLYLSKNQVRLAVQEMVTSSPRVCKQVSTLSEWRMAFDLIQRDITGKDEYRSTPSLPYSYVALGPEVTIRTLAEKCNIALPPDINFAPFLQKAEVRYREFRRLQLVSQGFRRALEMWLVLDLVLFLQEGGCDVALTRFCPREITPRNLHINAIRNNAC
ncbi:methyltransferase [Aestuariibacter sp. GS-14]|uniref:methyltransferase n=1 Tax=Aestuariibacter sp. GS-14 TaxID=2590670 RepID=UPI001128F281|nr:methyltransferase [Aestuariibacter sp. GS-14]TPV57876.1 methyltransferase [Aestuariibacter sp. GS-14]